VSILQKQSLAPAPLVSTLCWISAIGGRGIGERDLSMLERMSVKKKLEKEKRATKTRQASGTSVSLAEGIPAA